MKWVYNYMPANIIELESGPILPVSSILRDSDDVALYQITTSVLRNNEGQIITGNLPVAFTVSSDSTTSLLVDSHVIGPGETYECYYDVSNSNGIVELPITTTDTEGGKSADLMFEISGVTISE